MILYFTGTGNSRYIANALKEGLNEETFFINDAIKNDLDKSFNDENIIFVTPTYAWRIPTIIREWIEKTKFNGAKRIWFVMNCGEDIGNAIAYNKKLADKKALQYMGTMRIVMPENYLAMFNTPGIDKAKLIVEKAKPYIDEAIEIIKNQKCFPETNVSIMDRLKSGIVNIGFYKLYVNADSFYAKENCTSCGLCVKKCPLNNIKLVDGKPSWSKNCTHCMACICYCPLEAIEYGKISINKVRYHIELLEEYK